MAGAAGSSSCEHLEGAVVASDDDAAVADRAAALEVAKRSAWYHEPPPLLPVDVPLIEVHHGIRQTTIHRCPSRPRTAHPVLFSSAPVATLGRPATAEPLGRSSAELGRSGIAAGE